MLQYFLHTLLRTPGGATGVLLLKCLFAFEVYFHVFSPLSGLLWRNCDVWSFCSEIYWCNGSPGKTSFLT